MATKALRTAFHFSSRRRLFAAPAAHVSNVSNDSIVMGLETHRAHVSNVSNDSIVMGLEMHRAHVSNVTNDSIVTGLEMHRAHVSNVSNGSNRTALETRQLRPASYELFFQGTARRPPDL